MNALVATVLGVNRWADEAGQVWAEANGTAVCVNPLDVLARSSIALINTAETTTAKEDLTPAALTA
jgi:hypothetical protein